MRRHRLVLPIDTKLYASNRTKILYHKEAMLRQGFSEFSPDAYEESLYLGAFLFYCCVNVAHRMG